MCLTTQLYGISSFKILSDTQVWSVWVIVHCPYASLYGVGICLDFQSHPFICGLSITSKLAADHSWDTQRWMGYTICLHKQPIYTELFIITCRQTADIAVIGGRR